MNKKEIKERIKSAEITKKNLQKSEMTRKSFSVLNLIDYCDETIKLCKALLNLRKKAFESLSWMVRDMIWRYNQIKGNLDEGSEGGYSPELQEAIKLLGELKELDEGEIK